MRKVYSFVVFAIVLMSMTSVEALTISIRDPKLKGDGWLPTGAWSFIIKAHVGDNESWPETISVNQDFRVSAIPIPPRVFHFKVPISSNTAKVYLEFEPTYDGSVKFPKSYSECFSVSHDNPVISGKTFEIKGRGNSPPSCQ